MFLDSSVTVPDVVFGITSYWTLFNPLQLGLKIGRIVEFGRLIIYW